MGEKMHMKCSYFNNQLIFVIWIDPIVTFCSKMAKIRQHGTNKLFTNTGPVSCSASAEKAWRLHALPTGQRLIKLIPFTTTYPVVHIEGIVWYGAFVCMKRFREMRKYKTIQTQIFIEQGLSVSLEIISCKAHFLILESLAIKLE